MFLLGKQTKTMSKLFYDHLIIIEELIIILDRHGVSNAERKKLLSLIDETMNHHILDEILTHLPKEHHTEFLGKLVKHPNDIGLIPYLKGKTPVDIEKNILLRANKVKKELKKHIEDSIVS